MKKIATVFLALMLLLSFAACGKESTTSSGWDTDEGNTLSEVQTGTTEETPDEDETDMEQKIESIFDFTVASAITFNVSEIEIVSQNLEGLFDFSISDFKIDWANSFDVQDQAKLDGLSDAEIQEIATKNINLLLKLEEAFKLEGINARIDTKTGEVALDSSVLFGGDSAVLSDEGKDFLVKFTRAYASVVFSEEYEGFISEIMVEGHTAPVAGDTYDDGYPLSVERAENVRNFCLSDEVQLSEEYAAEFAKTLSSVGYSNSKPVTDDAGNVDMAASRRVSFRFVVNLD